MSPLPTRHSAASARLLKLATGVAMAVSLLACGGGGGVTYVKPKASTQPNDPTTSLQSGFLEGTAATGSALVGALVTVKDAAGQVFTASAPTDAQGHYRVSLSRAQAPYLVQVRTSAASNATVLYGIATAGDLNRTINVNQLSNLLVANLAEGDPSLAYRDTKHKALTQAQVDQALQGLQTKMSALLEASGVSIQTLLRTAFVPDHTGPDLLLDVVVVSTDYASGVADIANTVDAQSVRDLLSPKGADDSAQIKLRDPEVVRDLFSTVPGVRSRVQLAQSLVQQLNAALQQDDKTLVPQALVALCDAGNFLDSLNASCADWAQTLDQITATGSIPLALKQVVAFDVQQTRNTDAAKTAQKQISDTNFGVILAPIYDNRLSDNLAIELHKSGEAWRVGGDRRLVNVAVRGYAASSSYPSRSPVALKTVISKEAGVQLRAHSAHLDEATSVRVEVVGTDSANSTRLDLASAPTLRDLGAAINQDPVAAVYNVHVFKDDTEVAVYKTHMQSSRMPTNATIAQEVFPSITQSVDANACKSGVLNTSWTLPSGHLSVYSAMYCEDEGSDDYGMVELDHLGLQTQSEGNGGTIARAVPNPDTSGVVVHTLGADGVLYVVSQDTFLATQGMQLSSRFGGETNMDFNAANQATLDSLNASFPTVVFKTMGSDDLLVAICRTSGEQPGYLYSLSTAAEAQVTAVTEVSDLAGKRFSAVKCQGSTNGHDLRVSAQGAVTLSSTEQSLAGTLQTQTFSQAASQALLTGQAGSTSADGIQTWLHPFQVVWNDVTSWFVMETDQTPDNQLWTTIWRQLTS